MLARLAIVASAIVFAVGCTSPTEEEDGADDDSSAAAQTAGSADSATAATATKVTLPVCVVEDMPKDAKIRYLIAPKYIFRLEASALSSEGLASSGKISVSRSTRGGQPAALGTLDAISGELRFTLDRADVPVTSFTLDFSSLARGPLTAATKKHLSEIYTVYVMKDGWLGEAIAARCEGGGK
jgi:hypothetical protein